LPEAGGGATLGPTVFYVADLYGKAASHAIIITYSFVYGYTQSTAFVILSLKLTETLMLLKWKSCSRATGLADMYSLKATDTEISAQRSVPSSEAHVAWKEFSFHYITTAAVVRHRKG